MDEDDRRRARGAAFSRYFDLFFNLFRILTWAWFAVWVYPQVLDYVGGDAIARLILAHGWVRWVGGPMLAVCLFISVLQPIDTGRVRAAGEKITGVLGGTVIAHWKPNATYGMPVGAGLRIPMRGWNVYVRSWKRENKSCTVANALPTSRVSFGFAASGTGRDLMMLGGLQQKTMALALRQLESRAKSPEEHTAVEALGFLKGSPIGVSNASLDRRMVLRASEPQIARAVFASPEVISALLDLDGTTKRWSWSFFAREGALAEMTLERPGAIRDEDGVRKLVEVMGAGLAALADGGIVKEPTASAAG